MQKINSPVFVFYYWCAKRLGSDKALSISFAEVTNEIQYFSKIDKQSKNGKRKRLYFSKKEKCVLDLAFASGKVPNESKKEHFDKLKNYFNPSQITIIVSVISLFGFLNRWNDTFGTQMENVPRDFVKNELIPKGWVE